MISAIIKTTRQVNSQKKQNINSRFTQNHFLFLKKHYKKNQFKTNLIKTIKIM